MAYKNPMLVPMHWHLLVFQAVGVGLPVTISLYSQSKKKLITMPEIAQARQIGKIAEHAILIGHSYLGYGTQAEFTGQKPVADPSKVSQAYLDALHATLLVPDPNEMECPFNETDHGAYAVSEWMLGHKAGVLVHQRLYPAAPEMEQ